jgi:hypothetical protein
LPKHQRSKIDDLGLEPRSSDSKFHVQGRQGETLQLKQRRTEGRMEPGKAQETWALSLTSSATLDNHWIVRVINFLINKM